jgi:hypothetical protein
VWRGFDEVLQRPVAVKLPRPGPPRCDPAGEDLFLAEARKVARLAHPGIVPVYDVGRHGGAYFIVSALVEGYDLARRLRGGPFPVREAVRLVAEAARHLHYAHTQGFVHQDIKPTNLLHGWDGRLFVADFGIADSEEVARPGSREGSGAPVYMSPERLVGDRTRIDARTDVYSLGVVLYELLTGRRPFDGLLPGQTRTLLLRQEPAPPRCLRRGIPRPIERACLRCLAKSPVDRYPTARALAADLERNLKRRSGLTAAVAGLILALALVAGVVANRPWQEGTPPAAKAVVAPDDPAPGAAESPLVSPCEADLRAVTSPRPGRSDEEVVLFDGSGLAGWVTHGVWGKDVPDNIVQPVSGALQLRPGPDDYWFRTEGKYSDFVLRFGYRLPRRPHRGAGSTVLLRMKGPGAQAGAHLQVHFGGWATARVLPPLGALLKSPLGYEPLPGLEQAELPDREWNELEVTCLGSALAVRVNGKLVNQACPVVGGEGHIGFAPLGCEVDLRNIRVQKLVREGTPVGVSPGGR